MHYILTKAIAEMKSHTEQTDEIGVPLEYKVGSECKLNSWPDSSVGQSV